MTREVSPKVNYKGGLMVIGVTVLAILAFYFLPGLRQAPLNPTNQLQIYYMGKQVGAGVFYDEEVYLPFNFVQEYLDPSIKWNEKSKMVVITTDKEVFHLPLGKKDGLLNLEPYSFTYPVIEKQGKIYLPVNPINTYYNLAIKYLKNENMVVIHDLKKPIQEAEALVATKLRLKPNFSSAWTEKITAGQKLLIMNEKNGWYWVETSQGLMGYIDKNQVELTSIKMLEVSEEVYQPWNPLGEKIMLTWEGAWGNTVNPDKIGELPGVHVLSPTWFHLDENGLVKNSAEQKYVTWAHETGRQVWGLFDNGFDPDLTHAMLSDADLRIKVIKQLLTYVDLYQLDGINLDFENMYLKDKEAFVQFVRELTPLLHEKDRIVSVDVTFISRSENWSMCYDRESLGEIVDYMMVMAYDEHGTFSKSAGSVASLPWVERGIKAILEQVPNEKVILGVPFYTRLWQESIDENGQKKLSSEAISMERAEKWLAENKAQVVKDEATGQNYVEVKKGKVIYKMWLEDEYSLQKRIELMKKYRLAGIAAWRRGYEKEKVWPVMAEMLRKPGI